MPEIYDREGIASLRRQRPVRIYETPQEYYEGPAGANIGRPLLSLQREGLSLPMHTFLGENLTGGENSQGFWGSYFSNPLKQWSPGLINIERAKSKNRVGPRFGNRQLPLYIPGRKQDKAFMRKQEERGVSPHTVAGWVEQQSKNIPKGQRRPHSGGAEAILLSPQNWPDVSYEHLSPEDMVQKNRNRNRILQTVARHEAGHHALNTLEGFSPNLAENLNRTLDYLTSEKAPGQRERALEHLGKTEPEMIRSLEKNAPLRGLLDVLLRQSNARLIAQGRPTIDNQTVIRAFLKQRRQKLPRPVYPKAKHTGGMIERNPYPYEARAI